MNAKLINLLQYRKLLYGALVSASLSLVVVYYQIEPSPADYLMAIALLLAGGAWILRQKIAPFSLIDVPIAGYLVFVVMQALLQYQSIDVRFALISAYLIATYFVIKLIVVTFSEKALRWLFGAYVAGAIITSLLMAYQMVDVYSLGGDIAHLYWGRPNGWFKDANVAGPFLLPAVLLGLYKFAKDQSWRYLILFLVASSGVYLSFSRGAYLGYICAVGLMLVLILYWTHKQSQVALIKSGRLSAIAIVLALSVFLCWSAYQPFREMVDERFSELIKDYDTQGRASAWEAGLDGSKEPLFGSGSGSFEKENLEHLKNINASDSAKPEATESAGQQSTSSASIVNDDIVSGSEIVTEDGEKIIVTPSAHNTYIRVLRENGVFGFGLLVAGWLGLVIVGAKILWKWKEVPEWLKPYSLVAWASFVAYLPMGTFIDTLHWRYLWLIAGILGGIIYLTASGKEISQESDGESKN